MLSNDFVCESDSEFQAQQDSNTIPLVTQVKTEDRETVIYIHPLSPLVNTPQARHPVFKAPLAVLDYLGIQWRPIPKTNLLKNKTSWVVAIEFFWSLKDIEFQFANRQDYLAITKYLEQYRRTTLSNNSHDTVRLPYEVFDEVDKRWKILSIRLLDYSALLGATGLKTYAQITGVKMEAKDTFTRKEKENMIRMYLERPSDFDDYAKGDNVLHEVYKGAIQLFNYICGLLEIEPLEDYGMTTGTIVARIVSNALAKKGGFTETEFTYKDGTTKHLNAVEYFSQVCGGSQPINIQSIASLVTDKATNVPYIAMVDGGRAINATQVRCLEGILADVDIKSAYGNGLCNQLFPIGSPTKIFHKEKIGKDESKHTLREFLKKYSPQLIPGLWQARISTRPGYTLSFEQDLFISKVQKKFTLWENGHSADEWSNQVAEEYLNSENRIYDASMVLLTKQIHQAIIQHDLLQIAKSYFSSREWSELLDNCIVESALIYEKKNRRTELDKEKMRGLESSLKESIEIYGSKIFYTVPLEEIVRPLLDERAKQQELNGVGCPQEQIIKLVTNTIYGCIASQYFCNDNAGCSNTVVGNNITARCRALAWCMEKGLGTQMSITDGGVLDLNKIPTYRFTSAQIFNDLYEGKSFRASNRTQNIDFEPLFNSGVNKECASLIKTDANPKGTIDINEMLLDRLNKTFSKLDLFSKKQFTLTTKALHTKLIKHSKVDYALENLDGTYKYALRGMKKEEKYNADGTAKLNKNGEPLVEIHESGKKLFEAIEQGQPLEVVINSSELLSLAEWRNDYTSKNPRHAGLLPHDQISKELKFYSITPLGCRFSTMTEYKTMINEYELAKSSEDAANAVAQVAYDYGYPS